ncbi:hypothetical protein [Phaeobacter gallaeciensis]|nr:hypothetical protein [Phaeobacter gallaeciensis]MDE4140000.1 hypothetical protein [Phaeobacter gallaeciensis]MDE4148390.1 hypothetical protein [Phaeobacter gallaeciensis]MDE4152666.1 hypothetical protein [Phaeobacter gallaeciensis]MDE4228000.1 hypothetical protein [Phaeobacter gallaeciensis]MDE4257131.1 hypothetical protein [Phaeobacter gallaeciensis]
MTEVEVDAQQRSSLSDEVNKRLVRSLVDLVYAGNYDTNQIDGADNLETAMLALWSQQWPALRRRFSFRTAQLSRSRQSRPSGYEVELVDRAPSQVLRTDERWNEVAHAVSRDIVQGGTSTFRRFLWRYGADTSGSKGDLLHLASIYQQLNLAKNKPAKAAALINEIGNTFPDYHSAQLLKSELIQSTDTEYSLLPKFDQLDIALGLQSSHHASSFPKLGMVRQDAIAQWFAYRPADLINLLKSLSSDQNAFAESVFGHIAMSSEPEFMWQLLEVSETAFIRGVGSSLTFLNDERIGKISDEGLVQIIETLQLKNIEALEILIPRLLSRSNIELIGATHSFASKGVTSAVITRLADELVGKRSDSSVHPNWVECAKDNCEDIINFATNSVETRAQLLICRQLLGAASRKVPLCVWSSRLGQIKNDLPTPVHLDFQVFLLVQALASPDENTPVILQDTFDDVYTALSGKGLNYQSEASLAEHLPNLGWLQNWNKCLRLLVAVVGTYRGLGLSKKKLRSVTTDNSVKSHLEAIWLQV